MSEQLPKYRWVILGLTFTANIWLCFAWRSISPLLSSIKEYFLLTNLQVSLLLSVLSSTLVFTLLGGILADKFGVRKVNTLGLALMGISSLFRGFAPTFEALLLTQALFGLGMALSISNFPKLLRVWFTNKEFGLASGVNMLGVGGGSALAVGLTAVYALSFLGSWQQVLIIYSIPLLVIVPLWWLFVRESPLPDHHFHASSVPVTKGLRHVVKIKQMFPLACVRMVNGAAQFSFTLLLPLLLQSQGLTLIEAGLITSTVEIFSAIGNFLLPVISDRAGKRKPFITLACLAYLLAATFLALGIPQMLWIGAIIFGFFAGGQATILLMIPLELPEIGGMYGGTALGLLASIGSFTGIFTSIIIGYIMDVYQSFTIVLGFLALIALISLIAIFQLKESFRK